MWKQFITKRYWLRFTAYFLFYLFLYTLIAYFLREEEDSFWSLSQTQSRTGFAFFMALIFAYRQREQPAFHQEAEERVKIKWTVSDFLGIFGLLLFGSLVIMGVLLLIGWMIMHYLFDNNEPIGNMITKTVAVTAIMCFLTVIVLFLCDRFGIRWGRRS